MTALLSTPIEPMLAKAVDAIPLAGDYLFEPKWDGFRAIVFRAEADGISIQSRDLRPFDRYFPELREALAAALPPRCIVDGEIVVATPHGLDFDALQQRLHPAATRVARLARETPASFVVFDLLALDGASLMHQPQAERRAALERLLGQAEPPLYLTPATHDRAQAVEWLQRFEGAGLDGVVAKPLGEPYQPGKRAMLKIKHARTADCVVAGFRWHKSTTEGGPEAVGSLLLGLYDDASVLHHVGVTSAFTMAARRALVEELAPLRRGAAKGHPWAVEASGAAAVAAPAASSAGTDEILQTQAGQPARRSADTPPGESQQRLPGATSRWSAGKDLSWEPLRLERVCEVKYDHLQGDRFRHATGFLRWRLDKPPAACRYDQLEVVPPYELARVFARR